MHPTLENICLALDQLSTAIVNGFADDRTLLEIHGWTHPPLSRHDLANLPANIASQVRLQNIDKLDDAYVTEISHVTSKIAQFKGLVAYLFNGHGHQVIHSYLALIKYIETTLAPILTKQEPDWQKLEDSNAMPLALINRLKAIHAELEEIVPEKDFLKDQIDVIREATTAAQHLPVDLDRLRKVKKTVDELSISSAELFGKIDSFYKESEKLSNLINAKKEEADKLVAQCEDAYRITTTKGLAAAFDQRAEKLSNTMWIWVGGLLLSLVAGGVIGADRFNAFETYLKEANPEWGVIWMQFVLSIMGLAAPIWFAWLATKQIAQRFKLSEDYAFKASVAKAYEGYKKEAARIDEKFESRLFGSALTRLEEAPLRLMEQDHHSSPWQELMNSDTVKNFVKTIPEAKNQLVDLAQGGIETVKERIKSEKTKEPGVVQPLVDTNNQL